MTTRRWPATSSSRSSSRRAMPTMPADTSGSSGLRYDATTNQFIFTWQTSSSFSGKCYELLLDLSDGTQHVSRYKFTK